MKTVAFDLVTLCCIDLVFLVPSKADEFRPDMIVINANAITVDHDNSRAEAFAIQGGRFILSPSSSSRKMHRQSRAKRVTLSIGRVPSPGRPGVRSHM